MSLTNDKIGDAFCCCISCRDGIDDGGEVDIMDAAATVVVPPGESVEVTGAALDVATPTLPSHGTGGDGAAGLQQLTAADAAAVAVNAGETAPSSGCVVWRLTTPVGCVTTERLDLPSHQTYSSIMSRNRI